MEKLKRINHFRIVLSNRHGDFNNLRTNHEETSSFIR